MSESIAQSGRSSLNSNRPLQGSGRWNRDVRSAFMCGVAAILLVALAPHSNAEDTQKASNELGKSGQLQTDRQNQTADLKATKPKIKCMPKKPCPNTENPE